MTGGFIRYRSLVFAFTKWGCEQDDGPDSGIKNIPGQQLQPPVGGFNPFEHVYINWEILTTNFHV